MGVIANDTRDHAPQQFLDIVSSNIPHGVDSHHVNWFSVSNFTNHGDVHQFYICRDAFVVYVSYVLPTGHTRIHCGEFIVFVEDALLAQWVSWSVYNSSLASLHSEVTTYLASGVVGLNSTHDNMLDHSEQISRLTSSEIGQVLSRYAILPSVTSLLPVPSYIDLSSQISGNNGSWTNTDDHDVNTNNKRNNKEAKNRQKYTGQGGRGFQKMGPVDLTPGNFIRKYQELGYEREDVYRILKETYDVDIPNKTNVSQLLSVSGVPSTLDEIIAVVEATHRRENPHEEPSQNIVQPPPKLRKYYERRLYVSDPYMTFRVWLYWLIRKVCHLDFSNGPSGASEVENMYIDGEGAVVYTSIFLIYIVAFIMFVIYLQLHTYRLLLVLLYILSIIIFIRCVDFVHTSAPGVWRRPTVVYTYVTVDADLITHFYKMLPKVCTFDHNLVTRLHRIAQNYFDEHKRDPTWADDGPQTQDSCGKTIDTHERRVKNTVNYYIQVLDIENRRDITYTPVYTNYKLPEI